MIFYAMDIDFWSILVVVLGILDFYYGDGRGREVCTYSRYEKIFGIRFFKCN